MINEMIVSLATKNVIPGNYTLTVSARYENSITYSKILDLIIR
jgi:hypothetical protein